MYKQIVIILLLWGYISAQDDESVHELSDLVPTTEDSSPIPNIEEDPLVSTQSPKGRAGARRQISHVFSGPEITGIIFAVMLGIIIITLSVVFCIRKLIKRPSLPPQNADSEVP